MNAISAVACPLPLIGARFEWCQDSPKDTTPVNHPVKRQRTNTAPDGQVLPEWLTWTSYETTIGDEVYQTGEILQLPLTYYGPSIPLGPDWTYGGITSPAPGEATPTSDTPTTTTSPLAESILITSSPVEGPSSPSASPSGLPPASLQTGAGPLGTIPTSTPQATLSVLTPSAVVPFSIGTISSTSISGTSNPATTNLTQSSGTTSPTASPSPSSSTSSSTGLIPLLPAILAPLLTVIIILALLIYCFRRRERSQQGYTTAIGATSGGFGGWLTSSFARRANGSGERFTSAWTQVDGRDDSTPRDEASPVSPVSAENWAKSNERSALLGFIPNHHRASSSMDADRPPVPPKNEARYSTVPVIDEKEEVAEKEEALDTMADRNQSLLRRLNLGLLSVASLVSSRGSESKSRIASGYTLERGAGGPGALGTPTPEAPALGVVTDHSSEKTGTASADKSGTGSGSGNQPTTSGSGEPGISDDQLFYRAPNDTTSSRASTPSMSARGSPRTGFFSRFGFGTVKNVSSNKSKRSSAPLRKSWMSNEVVHEGEEEVSLDPGRARKGSGGMSIAVPLTPSTVDGERSKLGSARWDSRERLRFPRPPSGSAGEGGGERESLISSNNTEYHSAQSQYTAPSRPVSSIVEASQALHRPFKSDQENFARPALSPFGSKESFSPALLSRSSHAHDKDPSRIHLKDLFAASPKPGRPSIDSGGDSDLGHGGNRRSFAGQPMVDENLLHAISRGTGRGTFVGLGGIDEFGQTVRAVSEAPRIVTPSRWSRGQASEIASFHSGPSHISSKSSHSTGDSGHTDRQERLLDPEEVPIKVQALRGRRSQPQLIHRPSITLVTPSPREDHPMPWK